METWIMVRAKRARTAERPTQPSLDLRSRAPWFYPDPPPEGARNGRQRRQEGQGEKSKAEKQETEGQIEKATGGEEAEDALANIRAIGVDFSFRKHGHRLPFYVHRSQ